MIVSVSADGSSYLGTDPVTPAALPEKLKTSLLGHPEKKLYVKADARTTYFHVRKILDGINAAGVRAPALLTAQPEPVKPGTRVAPKGLEVLVGPPNVARSKLAVIQLLYSGQGSPVLKINGQNIPMRSLESRIGQILEHQPEKLVVVRADGQMPFARVVDVADRCQSAGVKVILGGGARAGNASATNQSAIMRGVGAFAGSL